MTTQNNGYSCAQMVMVLQSIARQMAALNGLLQVAQTNEDEWESARLVDAAQALAQGIGSLADEVTGCEQMGGMCCWHCGPRFAMEGGAA